MYLLITTLDLTGKFKSSFSSIFSFWGFLLPGVIWLKSHLNQTKEKRTKIEKILYSPQIVFSRNCKLAVQKATPVYSRFMRPCYCRTSFLCQSY